jgi:predicted DsbA family dithiol-disulfide isomerase
MNRLDVDIWSDVVCPWCAIGYAQFANALERLAGEIAVTVRWMPFELAPDMPPEGRLQAEHLGAVYSRTPEQVEAMRADIEAAGEAAGCSLAWTGEGEAPPAMMWNTFAAHLLLRWALAWKGPEVQTALKLALFDAYFRHRRNISDPAVLAEIAGSVPGLWAEGALEALADETLSAAVRFEEKRGRDSGLSAVPTFVVAGKYVLQGAQQPEQFARALVQIAQMEAAA